MWSNRDPWHSIYRGVHWVHPLWLLLSYGARYNGSMLIILREDYAGFFAKRLSNDLNSRFRSSDTTTSPGHLDDNISILTRLIIPQIISI
jgi:hypothetical protein